MSGVYGVYAKLSNIAHLRADMWCIATLEFAKKSSQVLIWHVDLQNDD